jgi:acyl-coenzyme A synthetase/AMP-(fatty) acid ligase
MLAAIGCRRTFSCVNPRWQWPQIRQVLRRTSSRFLFVDSEGEATIRRSTQAEDLNGLRLIRIDDLGSSDVPGSCNGTNPVAPTRQERAGAYLFTSGSTGEPKCVCISEQDLFWRARTEVAWYELTEKDVLLNLLPFSFDVGLNQILAAVFAGCRTVLMESWMPADIIEAVREKRVTGIPCVPSIWQELIDLNVQFDTQGNHRHLRFLTISGGDLPRRHLEQMPRLAPGVAIFKTYGQTEAFRAASLRPDEFATHKASVGKPFPGVTACVIRPNGTLAACNEIGELVHTGLGVMMGYLGDDSQSQLKLRPAPHDSNLVANYSGDNAYMDEDGYIYLVGRSDRMVKIKSNRVYPSEIRNLLCDLPVVNDAIVLAEEVSEGETIIVAFVLPNLATDEATLKRKIRGCLPGYMVPRYVQIVDKLPRTASGKPDEQALRALSKALVRGPAAAFKSAERPSRTHAEALSERITELVRERVDSEFDPRLHRLLDTLDSTSFLDVVLALDREFHLGVDLSKLGADVLASPLDLAEALSTTSA